MATPLKLFLLLEEHGKTNDCSVNQKTSEDRHDHRGDLNGAAMGKDRGKRCRRRMQSALMNQKTRPHSREGYPFESHGSALHELQTKCARTRDEATYRFPSTRGTQS